MSGKLVVVLRLAIKDLRHRPAEALLLLLAITAATTTLTLGLALNGTTDSPYQTTKAETNGPDVVAQVDPSNTGVANPAPLQPLEHASGVTAHGGPFPIAAMPMKFGKLTDIVVVEGRNVARSRVDQPKVEQGSWLKPGGIVFEAGFAQALGVSVGDSVEVSGHAFRVLGIAVTSAIPNYSRICYLGCDINISTPAYQNDDPGLAWIMNSEALRLAKAGDYPVSYFLDVRIDHPLQANAFVKSYMNSFSKASPNAEVPGAISWESLLSVDSKTISNEQTILLTASWLLALLALASVAVLVGGRMAEQTRRVGLLKSAGATPGLVAAVLLLEHVLVSIVAAVAGVGLGWFLAPLLTKPATGLLGVASAPSIGAQTVVVVLATAIGVAVVATIFPALRAARSSTVRALENAARSPKRHGGAIAISRHLPASLSLGLRLTARRPRRLLLSIFSIGIAASGIVAVLIVHAAMDSHTVDGHAAFTTVGNPQTIHTDQLTFVISVMLVALAAVNAIFVAWATVIDCRRSSALSRALGATQQQVTTGLSVAQLFPASIGALLGIPGGIAIYSAARHGGAVTVPPISWLVLMVAATLLLVALLTAISSKLGTRVPVVDALQSEAN